MPENRRGRGNPVARNPLLRKGGPHQKSRSGERHHQRQDLHAELEEWREEREWLAESSASEGADDSFSPLPPSLFPAQYPHIH